MLPSNTSHVTFYFSRSPESTLFILFYFCVCFVSKPLCRPCCSQVLQKPFPLKREFFFSAAVFSIQILCKILAIFSYGKKFFFFTNFAITASPFNKKRVCSHYKSLKTCFSKMPLSKFICVILICTILCLMKTQLLFFIIMLSMTNRSKVSDSPTTRQQKKKKTNQILILYLTVLCLHTDFVLLFFAKQESVHYRETSLIRFIYPEETAYCLKSLLLTSSPLKPLAFLTVLTPGGNHLIKYIRSL